MNSKVDKSQNLIRSMEEINASNERLKNVVIGDGVDASSNLPKNKDIVYETNFKDFLARKKKLEENRRKSNLIATKLNNIASQQAFKFRFSHSNYTGKEAIIAAIINKNSNPPRADYGIDLINLAIQKMENIELPDDIDAMFLVNTENSFTKNVINAYKQVVEDTHGKTPTQLGERADYITYR